MARRFFYEGDFENDFRHGTGHFRWANGESYKGDYLQDQRTGQGIYTWPDGSFYEGGFQTVKDMVLAYLLRQKV